MNRDSKAHWESLVKEANKAHLATLVRTHNYQNRYMSRLFGASNYETAKEGFITYRNSTRILKVEESIELNKICVVNDCGKILLVWLRF